VDNEEDVGTDGQQGGGGSSRQRQTTLVRPSRLGAGTTQPS
jgi:hypothetical protein